MQRVAVWVLAVLLASCGTVEATTIHEEIGLRLELPAAWDCTMEGEADNGRLTCLEGGSERFVALVEPDVGQAQVVGTELAADNLSRRLDILGLESTSSTAFMDGHFMIRLDYRGEQTGTWWVVLSTESASIYRFHLLGTDPVAAAMVERVRFVNAYPIAFVAGPLVVGEREISAWGVLAVGLFMLIALGRKLLLDLGRLFRDPGGLFGDFGRGENIWFPLAVVLCSGLLLTGLLAVNEGRYMARAYSDAIQVQAAVVEGGVVGHRDVRAPDGNADPEMVAMVMGGVRGRLIAAHRDLFSRAIWFLPIVWLVLWIANGTAIFLGGKAAKGEAIWTRSLYASALLAGPSAMFFAGGAMWWLLPEAPGWGWGLSAAGFVLLAMLAVKGMADLMRITTGAALGAWVLAWLVMGVF
ncbi:hypothetical protein IIA16_03940, partial [bacterium]|nr:hypothetical protein [bacterium]